MKKVVIALLMALFIFNTQGFTIDINIEEKIDPVSLDMLIKEGLIKEQDREKYINKESNTIDSSNGNRKEYIEKEEVEEENIDKFAVNNIKQIGENSIIIYFNQKLSENAYIKNNYAILDQSGKAIFRYSDFEVRKVISNDKAIVLKLKDKEFERNKEYKIIINKSLRSFYMIYIDNEYSLDNRFVILEDMKNNEILSYDAYSDGYIDIKFKYEVSEKLLSSKKNINIKYNDDRFMHSAKSINVLEDDDGVVRTIRVIFSKFQSKYDYKLTLKNLNLTNSEYIFPGGSALSNYFNVEDINIIDNYTIDIELDTKLNYTGDKELVRINSKVSLDNYELYGDNHIILHLKKDAGLDYLSQYSIELVNFTSIDNRNLPNISYQFSTEDYKVQKEYLEIDILEAKWIGEGYIRVSFNKSVDLYKNVPAFLKVKDEGKKAVRIKESYQVDPKSIIIRTESGRFNDAYSIHINNLPEKGAQFRSDEQSITIMN